VADDILFDNIIITDEKRHADDWAEQTWVIKHEQELAGTASAVGCSLFVQCYWSVRQFA